MNKKEKYLALNKYWIPALKHGEIIKKGDQCDWQNMTNQQHKKVYKFECLNRTEQPLFVIVQVVVICIPVPLKVSTIGMDETSGDTIEQPRPQPNSPENCYNDKVCFCFKLVVCNYNLFYNMHRMFLGF